MSKWHHRKGTRLYSIWQTMKKRCNNPNFYLYNRYGGRGIKVCDEWEHDFPSFRNWALSHGYQDGLTIDRIDNDGSYSPDNCRWATRSEQASNTSRNIIISYNGDTGTVAAICDKYGINRRLVYDRITKLGWDGEKAVSTQKRKSVKEDISV